ncbi:MAG: hypothetical protein ACI9GZ_000083, partial [Bacteroidia bacterium]
KQKKEQYGKCFRKTDGQKPIIGSENPIFLLSELLKVRQTPSINK